MNNLKYHLVVLSNIFLILPIFCQVFNSGIGLPPNLNSDATLHLYGVGTNGAGTRLIFGDDLGSSLGVRTYIAEFGWQNIDPDDSDILELHGANGFKFTLGYDKDNLIVPLEISATGFVKLNIRDTINEAASRVVLQDDGTLAVHSQYYIGQHTQGGIVFWVDETGEHGLVCDTADVSSGLRWYNGVYKVTNATGDGIGAGEMNSILIISQQTADNVTGEFAALKCANLTRGFYGDWYLPSLFELTLMYLNKSLLNFQPEQYWSSTEGVDVAAQLVDFADGTSFAASKNVDNRVRAIRAF